MDRVQHLQHVLAEFDIEGLIAIGAPQDEYSPEAQRIDELIGKAEYPDRRTLKNIVIRVLGDMFGLDESDLQLRDAEFEKLVQHLTTIENGLYA
jgi:hypothetical protein